MRKLISVEKSLRGFTLRDLFVADDDAWSKINKWCNDEKEVYFGEVAGKHSELTLVFRIEDFSVISEDQEFIDNFEKVVGSSFGEGIIGSMCNRCEECGDRIDEDEEFCDSCRETDDDDEE